MLPAMAMAIGLVLIGPVASATASVEPGVCTEGVFVVDGDPLVLTPAVNATAAGPETIVVQDGQAAIPGVCAFVKARIHATRAGTIVHARWPACTGARNVVLNARIDPACMIMTGTFRSYRPRVARRFVADACDDPATCPLPCETNADCNVAAYCAKQPGQCDGRGICTPRPDGCPDVSEPVCGCDGATYGNRCDAAAQGVNVRHFGACPIVCDPSAPIACGDGQFCEQRPGVCGRDDATGVCEDKPDACPMFYRPVCGCDGKTYGNDCERRAAGVARNYAGECKITCGTIAGRVCPAGQFCELPPASCSSADMAGVCFKVPDACPRGFLPVCGCDGKTYRTDCERRRAQQTLAHPGPCVQFGAQPR